MLTVLLLAFAMAADFTPQQLRGRTLYRKGTGSSGEPVIAMLTGGTEVKGNVVPCAGCHGLDGRGRAEGGVIPSSVRWEDLARPYEVTAPSGRKHAQYSERSLLRAITMGFDPAGNVLHNVMPRYALTRADADDLIAYLKRIANDHDPGLNDEAIRVGTLLPSEPRFAGLATVVRAALSAYFADLNQKGGLYGRRIEPVFQDAQAYGSFLERGDVFALVSSFLAGIEDAAIDAIEKQKVPLVGGWTLLPRTSPSVFFVDGGLPAQAEALATFAGAQYPEAVLLAGDDALSKAAAASVRSKWPRIPELRFPGDLAQATSAKALLVMLPGPQIEQLLGEAQRTAPKLVYLIPGALASGPLVRALGATTGLVYLASTFLPDDISDEARAEYRRLAATAKLPAEGVASQLTALCEARILVEGLKRAGRDLSRERLIESLEALYDFPAGYRQLVSFGQNRRIGIPGVHIVTVDTNGGLREVK